ncbi:inverse autotransporter beta domain-containing protein, partial [Enterobacter kobei]|uniref:inverse autotransporter beta domain-containing protein n=1 Tax=Enterobacter kobei TaxID=208224 RepID=UPI003F55430E
MFTQMAGITAGTLYPVMAVAKKEPRSLFSSRTALYTLTQGETVDTVAKRFGLSTRELETLNQFRTFTKPFSQLSAGDTLDVPVPQTRPGEQPDKISETNADFWASTAVSAGQLASSDDRTRQATGMVKGMATEKTASTVQEWLSQFGTARVELSVDDKFRLDNSSVDFLYPFYDSPNNVAFTQLGYRHKDSRNTINAGLGMRTFRGDWMYGINAFYDEDLTGNNRRLGLGLEAWTDYLKLSANSYTRLTDWHQSRDFADYDERPANGFDVRAEGWLPSYPQMGGRIVYEQYRGDEVALFSKDDRSSNPKAVTLGVNYTPVPLLTAGVDYRQGQGGQNDTKFSLGINYQFGVPLALQLDPGAVAARRTLAGSRLDLVERNNDIVLEYKKQTLITLEMPARLTGKAGDTGTLSATVKTKYDTDYLAWEYGEILAAGGSVTETGKQTLQITWPPYNAAGGNVYHVSAVAHDTRGNRSGRSTTEITVTEPDAGIARGDLVVTKDNAKANGQDRNSVQAKVTDASGNPVAGVIVGFAAEAGATVLAASVTTDESGIAVTHLTHTTVATPLVTATVNSSSQSVQVNFIADDGSSAIAEGDLTVTKDGAKANNTDTNAVQARVTDSQGNVVPGVSVDFSASNGATVISTPVITDENGLAKAELKTATAGVSTVTATINGNASSVNTTFVTDGDTAHVAENGLVITTDNAKADGKDQNVAEATVTDAAGNPVSGATVSFTTTGADMQIVTAQA